MPSRIRAEPLAGNIANMILLEKLKGDSSPLPPRPSAKALAFAWLGGFLIIAILACLANWFPVAMVLGSFRASSVLGFGYPEAPFSQPRNVVVGHFLSSLVGLVRHPLNRFT